MQGTSLAVAHDIPGRLRLRLPSTARAEGVQDAIGRLEGVTSCQWSPRTGSVLIRYRPDAIAADDLVDAVAAHARVDVAPAEDGQSAPPLGTIVTGTVSELNARVSHATAGRLNLALALPIGLTLWALFDVMRGPIRPLAWTTALWYAHGLFRDYALPESQR